MSEQNEQQASNDRSEAETTIVNTASVAAASASAKQQKRDETAKPADQLISEPANAPADASAPAAAHPATPSADSSDHADQNADHSGHDDSMRDKACSLAHSLGDLVGMSRDDAPQSEAPHTAPSAAAPAPSPAPARNNPAANNSAASVAGFDDSEQSSVFEDGIDDDPETHLTGEHPEFTNAFDIIDQMEGELEDARTVLFHSNEVRVDQQSLLNHLSELRDVLPVQLERASALMREAEQRRQEASAHSDKIVRAAHDEKDRILEEAHRRADVLAGQENVVAIARQKAQAILKDANARARKLTQGANAYTENVLTKLSEQLADFTQQTRGGITVLQQREQEEMRHFEQTRQEALHPGAHPSADANAQRENED